MYQIVVGRKLQGRGIFVTEDRNELNMAPTPTPDGKTEERPVILGRKLAAKERRTMLAVRNGLKKHFNDSVCHITPTGKGEGDIKGLCMACPVCFLHGGLRSGGGVSYGRPGIVLYDDAFSLGDSEIETLTFNAVSTKTQKTGTALATETFVFGGSFVNVISLKHDSPEMLNLVLDSIMSTSSYGARSRHYGRMSNEILCILKGPRPVLTSYDLVGSSDTLNGIKEDALKKAKKAKAKVVSMPTLDTPDRIMLSAHRHADVKEWYKEANSYLKKPEK